MPNVHNEVHDFGRGHGHEEVGDRELGKRILTTLFDVLHETRVNASILASIDRKQMSANEVLIAIRDNLQEASTELNGKIADLSQQLADAGADPALLESVSTLAKGLADIVPNAVATDPGTDLPPVDTTPPADTTPPVDTTPPADGTDVPPAVSGDVANPF